MNCTELNNIKSEDICTELNMCSVNNKQVTVEEIG